MGETKWTKKEKTQFKSNFDASDKVVSEWQRYGFKFQDAVEWTWWKVTPIRANRYVEAGIRDVPNFFDGRIGISLDKALEWQASGIDLNEARYWTQYGVQIKTAVMLRGLGKGVNELLESIHGWSLSPTQAVSWLAAGFDGETAFYWTAWKVSCSKAVKYREEGIHQAPDIGYREAGITLADALKWQKGFEDYESASDWIGWNVPASVAIELSSKDIYPPEDDFKDAGLSFEEAMEWTRSDFNSDRFERHDREGRRDWRFWYDAGFTPETAKEFHSRLVAHIIEIIGPDTLSSTTHLEQSSHDESDDSEIEELLVECVLTLGEIRKSGLTVTVDNAIKWRGLTRQQILASIDQGIDAEIGRYLGDSLLSTDELEIYSLLSENNFFVSPKRFAACGLKSNDLKSLLKLGVDLDLFVRNCESLNLDGRDLSKWVKEFKGATTGLAINESGEVEPFILEWIKYEFSAKDAKLWHSQGFKAEKARAWIESGATDPIVALRRKNAGLKPDSL
jgi:hypothetical protein